MDLSRLKSVLASEPSFRLKQVEEAIFKNLITNWDEAKNLPASLREKLKEKCPLEINAVLKVSKDNSTAKALIILKDGAKIETVLMKHNPKDTHSFAGLDEDKSARNSICVSTQVGCPMGCAFCATGTLGLTRSLTQDEIIEQILFFARHLKKTEEKITNITFMGMGEPFLNYDNALKAADIMNYSFGFHLSVRKITISTSGIHPAIERYIDEKRPYNLALSLNDTESVKRLVNMPVENKYPFEKIAAMLNEKFPVSRNRLTIEYVMRKDNISRDDAKRLKKMFKYSRIKLNLIPLNKGNHELPIPTEQEIQEFIKELEIMNVPVSIRKSMGSDISGACGQLSGKKYRSEVKED